MILTRLLFFAIIQVLDYGPTNSLFTIEIK